MSLSTLALPCHLERAAYRGYRFYYYHSRCGQSPRSTVTFLAGARTVDVYWMGQNDPARLQPGIGYGC
jgi:hypothetical protein